MSETILPLALLKVTGEDHVNFLQGQLTQDMNLTENQWSFAAQCNPQGRVIAFFMTFVRNGSTFLITDKESSDQAIEQLKKYVMRSKVSFELCAESIYFNCSSNTHDLNNNSDEAINLVSQDQESIILQHFTGAYYCSQSEPENCSDALQWRKSQINAGIPFLTNKALNKFTPESINLDLLNAVNFNKGCYTGQEIVARMHYLGKAKKRLFKVKIEGKLDNIKISDNITESEGKTIGHLVDFVNTGEALITLKTSNENLLHKSQHTIKSINGELLL